MPRLPHLVSVCMPKANNVASASEITSGGGCPGCPCSCCCCCFINCSHDRDVAHPPRRGKLFKEQMRKRCLCNAKNFCTPGCAPRLPHYYCWKAVETQEAAEAPTTTATDETNPHSQRRLLAESLLLLLLLLLLSNPNVVEPTQSSIPDPPEGFGWAAHLVVVISFCKFGCIFAASQSNRHTRNQRCDQRWALVTSSKKRILTFVHARLARTGQCCFTPSVSRARRHMMSTALLEIMTQSASHKKCSRQIFFVLALRAPRTASKRKK